MGLDEAKNMGAMALFGEKYGDRVRVVDIGGPWSRELCAGTHVSRSSEVGLINLVSEASVGSSNRRVEALVGTAAFQQFALERALVSELTTNLKAPREDLVSRVADLIDQLKGAEKRIAQFEADRMRERVPALAASAVQLGSTVAVLEQVGVVGSADDLRLLASEVRDRLQTQAAVIAIGGIVDGKAAVIVATTAGARDAGFAAGAFAKRAAAILGGGGGGRDDMAQGGGPAVDQLGAALADIRSHLEA